MHLQQLCIVKIENGLLKRIMVETKKKELKRSDYKRYFEQGIDYPGYKQQMAADLAYNKDLIIQGYINLNQRRMYRIEKTYRVSERLTAQVQKLQHKTYWLIITESWCGDASQILPVLNQVSAFSEGKIEMKMVYRDQNPELMDVFLTNQSRSIPKVIQLDSHFNLTGVWGPRPNEAQKLVMELKADLVTAENYATILHLWYAKDHQKSIELDVSKLLVRANIFCTDCLS